MIIELSALAALFALSAFFSGYEAAFLSISRIRLKFILRKSTGASVKSLVRLKGNATRTLMAILIGNNVVNVSASFLAAHITTNYFGEVYLGVATGVMTLLLLVFSEVVPKTIATVYADRLAVGAAPVLEMMVAVCYPLIFFMEALTAAIPGVYRPAGSRTIISEEELRAAFELGVEDRAISLDERQFFERVLDFNDTYVKEVMTPAKSVKVLGAADGREEILKKAARFRKRRYPVLGEQGQVVGVLSIRKLIESDGARSAGELADAPMFVSKEMVALNLFKAMQKSHVDLAIVLGSGGHMDGIVTIEDLVEEIMGEMDRPEGPGAHPTAPLPALIVSGDTRLHDLEKALRISLPTAERFGSVSAFLHYNLKRLPVKGDAVVIGRCRLEVREVSSDWRLVRVQASLFE